MFEADRRWMVRIPRWKEAAESLGFEVHLLEFLEKRVSARLPRPLVLGTLDRPRGWPYWVYPRIPGVPLSSLSRRTPEERVRLVRFLGRLLTDLAACPVPPLERMGIVAGDPKSFGQRFERLRSRYLRSAAPRIPAELGARVTGTFDAIAATLQESRYRPILVHNDLWPSHILWDRRSGAPTGVIDWEDARLGDPAADLVALEGLGPAALAQLGEGRRPPSDRLFWHRLALYRRVLPLGGYLFGIETKNSAVAGRHLRALRRTLTQGSREAEELAASA
jgi:aminoglycoside phosphotransferase (APT) family kinase protein